MSTELPTPILRHVFRIDASLGDPVDLGETPAGRRRIVPLTGGRVTGAELSGAVLPAGSADWQLVRDDGSSVGDIRITLRTDAGHTVYVQSRATRHGPPEVLARLARGDQVPPSEYTFRSSTAIETAAPELAWLNRGVFVAAGGRGQGGVSYDVYVVE